MTRNEFIEDITDFGDLKNFCCDERIYICDCVMDGEYFDEIIMDRIRERGYFDTWQEVYRFLHDLPDGAAYYIENDYGEISEATEDDFEELKQQVLEHMDEHGEWEPEDEDTFEEDAVDDDEEIDVDKPAAEEDLSNVEITTDEFYMILGKAG